MNKVQFQKMDTATHPSPRKRPPLVWVIFVFFVVSATLFVASIALTLSGTVPIYDSQQNYLHGPYLLDHALAVMLSALGVVAATTLFRLKRQAPYLFSCAFALNLAITVRHAVSLGWMPAVGAAGVVGAFLGLLIVLVTCVYSWLLLYRRTLS